MGLVWGLGNSSFLAAESVIPAGSQGLDQWP